MRVSHSRTVPSWLAEASRTPSGWNASAEMRGCVAAELAEVGAGPGSQIRMISSSPAVATAWPSGRTARA